MRGRLTYRNAQALTLVTFLVATGSSAYGQKKRNPKPAAEPTIEKRSALLPSLAALQETPQSQTKSGLRITLAPETYVTKESWTTQSKPANPPTLLGLVISPPSPNAVYVETTKSPELIVSPDTLLFHVHLSNQMPRVFRGSGIAVQFNVAGKVQNVDPSAFGDLTNIIIPPRGEQEITILGPKISAVPAPSTIGVFFYDVVTNMDQAGNVTEKQNFEWYFSYQTQAVEKEFSTPPPTKGWAVPNAR